MNRRRSYAIALLGPCVMALVIGVGGKLLGVSPGALEPSTVPDGERVPLPSHPARPRLGGALLPGPIERDNAILHLREVIGATDPAQAAEGTIRRLYAESKGRNSVHASDGPASAEREVKLFFGVAALAR